MNHIPCQRNPLIICLRGSTTFVTLTSKGEYSQAALLKTLHYNGGKIFGITSTVLIVFSTDTSSGSVAGWSV